MKLISFLLLIALVAVVAKTWLFSFRFQSPKNYADTSPEFDLTKHLSGEIQSEGLIFGPNGKMTNSFTAKMVGEWQGANGTLSEEFTYSNGVTQTRKWYLTLGANNTFTGTADDLIGTAHGVVSGATVQLSYTIKLPDSAGGHVLKVTDWMYLTESGVIINKSEMRKFGLKVAELVATMRPQH